MRIPTHVLAALAGATLLSPALVSCTDDAKEERGPAAPDGPLAEALDTLPASTQLVRFVNREVAAGRVGIGDVESLAGATEQAAYEEALGANSWAFTEIGGFATVMDTKGAFSELDVVWEARGAQPNKEGRLDGWAVFRMEETLDLATVAASLLEVGYTESQLGGQRHFTAPPAGTQNMVGGIYPAGIFGRVTLLPDQHLIVTGAAQPVLDVVLAKGESLFDKGTFAEVAEQSPGLEYAELRAAATIDCVGALPGARDLEPEVLTGVFTQLGMTGLTKPRTSALYVVAADADDKGTPPLRGVTVLEFADEKAARADAEARQGYVSGGIDQITRLPMAQLYTPVAQTVDGSRSSIEWTYSGDLGSGVLAHQTGAGVASCTEL